MSSIGDMILRQMIREIVDMPKLRTVGDVIDAFKSISSPNSYDGSSYDIRQRGRRESPASDLKVSRGPLRALMVGDSQLGGALGTEFERKLQTLGFKVDKKLPIDGGSPSQVADALESSIGGHQLVVSFTGGNDASVGDCELAVTQMHSNAVESGAYLIVVGPPPATVATDVASLNRSFREANSDVEYQLKRDEGRFAQRRIAASDAIDDMNDPNAGLFTYGIASHHSVDSGTYQNQPDGLHCFVGAANIVDEIFDNLDISSLVQQLSDQSSSRSLTTLAGFDYDRWVSEISKIEGDYDDVNPHTAALGKYQFVPSYWWDEIKDFAGDRLPSTHSITRYTPVGTPVYDDYEAFLGDPKLQEDWMRHYTMQYAIPAVQTLRREFPEKTASRSDGQLAALYHFQGLGGARDWFSSGVMSGRDINAIDPDQYMSRIT